MVNFTPYSVTYLSNSILLKAREGIAYPAKNIHIFKLFEYIIPPQTFFLVVSEVSKAGDVYHWPFFCPGKSNKVY